MDKDELKVKVNSSKAEAYDIMAQIQNIERQYQEMTTQLTQQLKAANTKVKEFSEELQKLESVEQPKKQLLNE